MGLIMRENTSTGLAVFVATFLVSLIYFYSTAGKFWQCVVAALLTAAIVYMSYAIIRWMILAIRK
jgi:hypothetical protein